MLGIFGKTSGGQNAVLLVGLGNPGPQYEFNRHNIGFMALDAIAAQEKAAPFRAKFQGLWSELAGPAGKVFLLKPQTYMNESGRSVAAMAKFYKIPPARIFVFHDELDLSAGKIRMKQGGGNAGHNGLKSLDAHLGTADYWRVRLGIGHPGERERVHGHVLGDFGKSERIWLDPLLAAVGQYGLLLAQGKSDEFMSKVAAATSNEGK